MGMMIRSFFPEPHLALLRLIEYADHEPMSQSQQKQVLIFACKGIAVTILFYVMAQLCSSVLGFTEFYSCQWGDTMPTCTQAYNSSQQLLS
jgi:hypothetical protein